MVWGRPGAAEKVQLIGFVNAPYPLGDSGRRRRGDAEKGGDPRTITPRRTGAIQLHRRSDPWATARHNSRPGQRVNLHMMRFTCFPMTDRRNPVRYPALLEISQTRKSKADFRKIEALFSSQLYQYDHKIEAVSRVFTHGKASVRSFFKVRWISERRGAERRYSTAAADDISDDGPSVWGSTGPPVRRKPRAEKWAFKLFHDGKIHRANVRFRETSRQF